jgi:hypothetical protein
LKNFHPDFAPQVTPQQMLAMGVFGGKYMTDCVHEFPGGWFRNAKLCHEYHDPRLNFFGVNASQPLSVWRAKGWILSIRGSCLQGQTAAGIAELGLRQPQNLIHIPAFT